MNLHRYYKIMYIQNLKQILIPSNTPKTNQKIFWLILSLTFATIYSLLALKQAFSGEYIVQDDARQHVFWMRRFLDPELFPNDLIANYFQSVAPWGYKTFYWLFSQVGIDPIFLNKLLPLPLSLITAAYCFGICFQILPIPFAAFIASVLLSQNIWLQDDIASGTPRAFLYPLFLAVLYYLLRQSLVPFLVAIALLGLFYPQYVILTALILIIRLLNWEKRRFCLSKNPQDYLFSGVGLGLSLLVILFYALNSSNYEPVITAAQARILPEFGEAGRSVFFLQNSWDFFIFGGRSGILPQQLFLPHILILGLFLPILFQKEEGRGKREEGSKKKEEEEIYNFDRARIFLRRLTPTFKKEEGGSNKQQDKIHNFDEARIFLRRLTPTFKKEEGGSNKQQDKIHNFDEAKTFLRRLTPTFKKEEGGSNKQQDKIHNFDGARIFLRRLTPTFKKEEGGSNKQQDKIHNFDGARIFLRRLTPTFKKEEGGSNKQQDKIHNFDEAKTFLRRLPLIKQITPNIKLLVQIFFAGVVLFVAAHLLLFKLHLPSRYTNHSFRIILAIATAVVLCIILDAVFQWVNKQPSDKSRRVAGLIFIGFLGILFIGNFSLWKNFSDLDYQKGKSPEVYQFFAQQPKYILIASLSEEANYIPTFSQRSVLFAWEYAIPYHLGYYNQIKQRATEFIFAQYHSDIQFIQNFINTYETDFLILDRQAFMPEYVLKNRWLRQWYHQMGNQIGINLQNGTIPAIFGTIDKCSVLETENLWVLEADCILNE
ncbi:hypothetical protein [Okeania sp. SIO2B3]|uniref:hypothetical protein n=1 Tax=Okeania sp. SIO2B3 TaxID=2607784 RepID=UPI0025E53824|nr:hypothetical protein [Okeania sp. SIO2B3]